MTTIISNVIKNKWLLELDGLVGLPNGDKPEPLKYNLGKINKYLNETGKEF